ncbi:hypothetical protein KIAC18_002113 [Sporomusa sphaeroides]|uniref:hypothetical protein n=1 Tax=Sporomusa sphaeroides TaxID=47679 RepID=UPI003D9FC957
MRRTTILRDLTSPAADRRAVVDERLSQAAIVLKIIDPTIIRNNTYHGTNQNTGGGKSLPDIH